MSAAEDFAAQLEEFRARAGLNPSSQAVLDRLRHDDETKRTNCRRDVVAAFSVVPSEKWKVLLDDCIHAGRASRDHKRIADEAKRTLEDAPAAVDAFETVAAFPGRQPERDHPLNEANRTLRETLFYAQSDAKRVLQERSRKTDAGAARSAAIGWIAGSILRLSGRPNRKHVITLVEAVLDLYSGEVTEAAVRNASLGPARRDSKTDWTVFVPLKDGRYKRVKSLRGKKC